MKTLLIAILGFATLPTNGQNVSSSKNETDLYSHSVDSLIKYILNKESPSSIILETDISILNLIPNVIQGQEIIKVSKKKKIKAKNNSVWIYIHPLGGTKTKDKRSVFLVVTKYIDGSRTSWEGYGGYNFEYSFDQSQNNYLLLAVSKSIMIR